MKLNSALRIAGRELRDVRKLPEEVIKMHDPWSIDIHEGEMVEGKVIEEMGQPIVNPENGNLIAVPVKIRSHEDKGEEVCKIVAFGKGEPHCYESKSEEVNGLIENSPVTPEIIIYGERTLIVRVYRERDTKTVKINLDQERADRVLKL